MKKILIPALLILALNGCVTLRETEPLPARTEAPFSEAPETPAAGGNNAAYETPETVTAEEIFTVNSLRALTDRYGTVTAYMWGDLYRNSYYVWNDYTVEVQERKSVEEDDYQICGLTLVSDNVTAYTVEFDGETWVMRFCYQSPPMCVLAVAASMPLSVNGGLDTVSIETEERDGDVLALTLASTGDFTVSREPVRCTVDANTLAILSKTYPPRREDLTEETTLFTYGDERHGEDWLNEVWENVRTVTWHIRLSEWSEPEEYTCAVPSGWAAAIDVYEPFSMYRDAEKTQPMRKLVPADGQNYEIWVTNPDTGP